MAAAASPGLERIDVEPDQEESARPVAANDVALLGADKTAIVEPLANDVDPMGGVLAVTDVRADAKSGIKAGIVGNKRVYITAQTLPSGCKRAFRAGAVTGAAISTRRSVERVIQSAEPM